jgi:hypothetical protein|tara:strand:- start:126 stop:506 length:381 start_codon:yes stop_codon:yes gene_type:complete
MSNLKLCQGTRCHTYFTKDRLKGTKGNKTYQTRRRSFLIFNEFCSTQCYHDWFSDFGDKAINHFGRLTEPKHLTEDNAWVKDWDYPTGDYMGSENRTYVFRNAITKETRPLTEEQYNDNNYTLNER